MHHLSSQTHFRHSPHLHCQPQSISMILPNKVDKVGLTFKSYGCQIFLLYYDIYNISHLLSAFVGQVFSHCNLLCLISLLPLLTVGNQKGLVCPNTTPIHNPVPTILSFHHIQHGALWLLTVYKEGQTFQPSRVKPQCPSILKPAFFLNSSRRALTLVKEFASMPKQTPNSEVLKQATC